MIDMIVTQRMNLGMEDGFEAVARQLEAGTPAHDQGCRRYEWYRSGELRTFILLGRWTEEASAQAHLRAPHFSPLMPKLRASRPGKSFGWSDWCGCLRIDNAGWFLQASR
jgi:quinol monooxygenase YgiN